MTELLINPKIALHVDAALAAGFTAYALPTDTPRPAGFVAVCLDEDGPWAHIQVPTNNWDPVQLDVPIRPHKDYGSGVHVDHDGTPEDAVRALQQACSENLVTVRFMTRQYIDKHGVPKVPNHGRKCIERWPGGAEFTKLEPGRGNWRVQQQAGRLEIGDRFIHNGQVVEVQAKRYTGHNYDDVTITPTGGPVITMSQREFVTLLGAA
ncbi:hypothetical protein SEA_BRUHMOMENT_94 [Arthrobacter phage BruhMoment]|nr:hypothetical protein SEA_BRUHMOMENT_94 [Arthrobacter phage BruhMoment]